MSSPAAVGVSWDLSSLFTSLDDPRIEACHQESLQKADDFAARYKGKVADLDGAGLAKAIREMESLLQESGKPSIYANLIYSADASKPEHGAFLQAQAEKASEISVKLMFFELEIQALSAEKAQELEASSDMAPYLHFFQVARVYSPHSLSEVEEALIEKLKNTGSRAWVRLHDEVFANQKFPYKDPLTGEESQLIQSKVLEKLRDPRREVREAAAAAFSAGLSQVEKIICFIFNTLMADKKMGDSLRHFEYPEQSRHMANELSRETVDLVTGMCRDRSDLVSRYYHVKREILGLEELTHVDRYAPLFDAKETSPYTEAQATILDAFSNFSPVMAERAKEFFDKNWIDADPREGKTGGAFCSYVTPDTHPVIMMSYLGTLDNVMTLAHELGHGVHASLSRAQTYFNFHGTLPLAELASIFGEMLVFEKVVAGADLRDKTALYAQKIEGIFASVHRQAAMFRFEVRCHQRRREAGELSPSDFRTIWQEELQSMFQDSVMLGEEHAMWWTYIGHFFFAPFYVYAYSFGELLTLAIYQMSKEQGPSFADKYLEVLELGGSLSPQELMAKLDVNLSDPAFWEGGFRAIEAMVSTFENSWKELQAQGG